MPYLVDGNNLAHVMGLSAGGLADREACGRIVDAFCRAHGAQAVVVFDGPAPEGTSRSPRGTRVRIEFGEGRSADDSILALLRRSKTPADFILITSDKSLGDRAKHLGAKLERAHVFARRLRSSGDSGPRPVEKRSHKESAQEIEAWLKIFESRRT